jgi:hypothetical protein
MEESKEPMAVVSDFKIDDRLRDGFKIPFGELIQMSFGPLQGTIQWLADRQAMID